MLEPPQKLVVDMREPLNPLVSIEDVVTKKRNGYRRKNSNRVGYLARTSDVTQRTAPWTASTGRGVLQQ